MTSTLKLQAMNTEEANRIISPAFIQRVQLGSAIMIEYDTVNSNVIGCVIAQFKCHTVTPTTYDLNQLGV